MPASARAGVEGQTTQPIPRGGRSEVARPSKAQTVPHAKESTDSLSAAPVYLQQSHSLGEGCDQTVTYRNQPEINPRQRLLRLKDAAHYLSLSPWKLRRLIWEGRLPVVQDCEGSPFLFDRHDLDSYVESHKRNFPL